jgi:hypothetical protein
MMLEGFSGTALSAAHATAFTAGLANSLGIDTSRVELLSPAAAARVAARSAARSISARVISSPRTATPVAADAAAAATPAGRRRLLSGLEVAFTISGFGTNAAAASSAMAAISSSAVSADSSVISSLAAAGMAVTLRIAMVPSASVTVAITIQYASAEEAAAGAAAVSDAISGGALADQLSAIAPSLSLEAAVLPDPPPPPPAPATPPLPPDSVPAGASPPVAPDTPPASTAPPPAELDGHTAANAAATTVKPSDERRTVAIAVSLTLGAVIIIVGAVLTSLSHARRRDAAAAALLEKEGGSPRGGVRRSLRRGAPSRENSGAAGLVPTRHSSLLSEASLDGSERSSQRGTTRLASLDPYAPRRTRLLAVAVDADDDDLGYAPPEEPQEHLSVLQTTQRDSLVEPRDSTRWITNTPRVNPVTRGEGLGVLTGCEEEEAAAAQVDGYDALSPRAAEHGTPRSSAWRAPAQLGGEAEEADDGEERAPRASSGGRPGLRSNSGTTRVRRRSSVTNAGEH